MSFSKSFLSQPESVTKARRTLPQETAVTAEAPWEKVLDDPSLRRLLRDGHRAKATTSLLSQLEEGA